jgi:hypothetical protein
MLQPVFTINKPYSELLIPEPGYVDSLILTCKNAMLQARSYNTKIGLMESIYFDIRQPYNTLPFFPSNCDKFYIIDDDLYW